jgi:hypothetical protein
MVTKCPEYDEEIQPEPGPLPPEHQALNRVFALVVERFRTKNVQYTGVSDRLLKNFYEAPPVVSGYLTARQLAWTLASKHIQFLNDLLFADRDMFLVRGGDDALKESLGDLATYTLLLLAIVHLESQPSTNQDYDPGV